MATPAGQSEARAGASQLTGRQWHVAPEDGAMAYTAAGGIDEDMDGEDVEDSDEEGDMFTSAS